MTRTTARKPPGASRFTARVRRRRIVRSLLVLAVLALGGAGVWLVAFSDVLTVADVQVDGVDGELADAVRDAADVPMGEQLIYLETGGIQARVQEIPELAEVSVSRSWPNSVTISVSRRVPLAAVADDRRWWSVDADGVLFGRSSSQPKNLPVIEAPLASDDRDVRAAAVAVATSLPKKFARQVDVVVAESIADIRLELADGPVVRWGTAERSDEKAAVLSALIDEYAHGDDAEPPEVYDVSAPERPAVSP